MLTALWMTQRGSHKRCNDEFGLQNAFASRVRILVKEGAPRGMRHRAAGSCRKRPRDEGGGPLSRGLALATLGRFDEARSLATEAEQATKGIEARVLVAAIDAICALKPANGRDCVSGRTTHQGGDGFWSRRPRGGRRTEGIRSSLRPCFRRRSPIRKRCTSPLEPAMKLCFRPSAGSERSEADPVEALSPRTRGVRADLRWLLERRDCGSPIHHRRNCESSRSARVRQAGCPVKDGSCDQRCPGPSASRLARC